MIISRADSPFYYAYISALIIGTIIRLGARKLAGKERTRGAAMDRFLLMLTYMGMGVFPLLYMFTDVLDSVSYSLPLWSGIGGAIFIALSLVILWKAHADLGENWSKTLNPKPGLKLVTEGLYSHVRHPIYVAYWLWAIAQPLLLHNIIAGFSMILAFAPLYFYRVPREEKMIRKAFGEEYEKYIIKTPGKVVPCNSIVPCLKMNRMWEFVRRRFHAI